MEITRTARGEEFEIKLKGRLDATWSDHVAAALADCLRAGQQRLLVDMAAVEYISSAGIRILVLYARQLSNIQDRLRVIHASATVQEVLELAGLDRMLMVEAGAAAPATSGVGNGAGRLS